MPAFRRTNSHANYFHPPDLPKHESLAQIVGVLGKYGVAGWIERLGPDFAKDFLKSPGGVAIARLSWETRFRMALSELGPTFIKLGQFLSTRPDLVGVSVADELQRLQSDVPADPPEVARGILEIEFRAPPEELFDCFADRPLASASIGQVHRARLKTGEEVVVKIQKAGIQRKVEVDLDILTGLAQLAERIPEFENYRPNALAAEFRRVFRHELDFTERGPKHQAVRSRVAGQPRRPYSQVLPRIVDEPRPDHGIR